ncbi:MAG TPA: hypothetical protein VFF68_12385 [Anaerolineaceae bacterium]|nr:hypothetical protein [Anaerolineaceae bacterium]
MPVFWIATGHDLVRVQTDGTDSTVSRWLEGKETRCLAVDPTDSRVIYAGTRGAGLWRIFDEDLFAMPLPESDVFSVAVSRADGAVYAGTEPSRLFCSRDRGETWVELEALQAIPSRPNWSFPPRPWTSHVRAIAPHPTEPELVLVGIELGGLMVTRDGGQSFSDHRPGAQRDVHALLWHPSDPEVAYEAGGGGSAWSLDRGQNWRTVDRGLELSYTWAVAADPEDPQVWYVAAASGPRAAHSRDGSARARIYRWQEDGPWQPLGGGLPDPLDSMPYALCFHGGRLYAGLKDGRIYYSDDGGDAWRRLELASAGLDAIETMIVLD